MSSTGVLLAERIKLATPQPSAPPAVADVVRQLAASFRVDRPGRHHLSRGGRPGRCQDRRQRRQGLDRDQTRRNCSETATGLTVGVLNDADAAGVAEMRFGAGADEQGTVLMLTFGTGIGSALFVDGLLVPNTEFGHVEVHGHEAEKRASELVREENDLSWGKWAGRVDEYLVHMEMLLSPGLIIIGGGVSRKSDKFLPLLTGLRARVVPAALHNDAGIVGAAMAVA